MQEIAAWLILAVIAVAVVLPAIGACMMTGGDSSYLQAMAVGAMLVGLIATVVGGILAGGWALDILGIIDSPRF